MALVSLFGGLALANSKLGAVHGFAGPLGGMLPKAAHGAICGRLLPFVMGANLKALRDREPANPALTRYTELAQILTGDPTASAPDGVSWVRECCARLDIEPLRNVGLGEADFEAVVDKARQASSMKGNPITLTNREMHDALQEAL
jgi:alcohol dehydrogenase class IV